jgi:hypothetical protein
MVQSSKVVGMHRIMGMTTGQNDRIHEHFDAMGGFTLDQSAKRRLDIAAII